MNMALPIAIIPMTHPKSSEDIGVTVSKLVSPKNLTILHMHDIFKNISFIEVESLLFVSHL